MSESIEDFATGILAKIAGFCLVIAGVSWLVKWIWNMIVSFFAGISTMFSELFKSLSKSYSCNTSLVWSVVVTIVGLCLFIKLVKSLIRMERDKRAFLAQVEPQMKSLERELQLQTKLLKDSEWGLRESQMEKTLAAAGV